MKKWVDKDWCWQWETETKRVQWGETMGSSFKDTFTTVSGHLRAEETSADWMFEKQMGISWKKKKKNSAHQCFILHSPVTVSLKMEMKPRINFKSQFKVKWKCAFSQNIALLSLGSLVTAFCEQKCCMCVCCLLSLQVPPLDAPDATCNQGLWHKIRTFCLWATGAPSVLCCSLCVYVYAYFILSTLLLILFYSHDTCVAFPKPLGALKTLVIWLRWNSSESSVSQMVRNYHIMLWELYHTFSSR